MRLMCLTRRLDGRRTWAVWQKAAKLGGNKYLEPTRMGPPTVTVIPQKDVGYD